jgi:hypothetical protein
MKSFPDPEGRTGDELYRVTLPRSGACPRMRDLTRTAAGAPIAGVDTPRGELTVFVPESVAPQRELHVTIALRNDGDLTWPATAVDPNRRFAAWYKWLPADGGPPRPWRRIPVPLDLPPGAPASFAAWVAPPGRPGRHVLAFRAGQGPDPAAPLSAEQPIEVRAPVVEMPAA